MFKQLKDLVINCREEGREDWVGKVRETKPDFRTGQRAVADLRERLTKKGK